MAVCFYPVLAGGWRGGKPSFSFFDQIRFPLSSSFLFSLSSSLHDNYQSVVIGGRMDFKFMHDALAVGNNDDDVELICFNDCLWW